MRHRKSVLVLGGLVLVGVLVGWRLALPQAPRYETRIVVLKAKANLETVFGNRAAVKRLLMQTAERSQRELLPLLEDWRKQGEVRRYRRFWIINAIAVEGTERVFDALSQHPAVAAIRPSFPIPAPRPIPSTRIVVQQNYTWGLRKIRVPEAWQTFQVQGEGVVVGVIDTGIDPNHPDLQGKLRPVNGWFDALNGQPTPYDDIGHGTHVAGTIAGGNASGVHIGVAPRATLIVARALGGSGGTFESVTAAMQWVMDPDGDPNTDDGADVVNNSWRTIGSNSPNMIAEWRDILNAWIAARIFPAFSIGNEGPNPRTTGSPGDYPMAFGVGATDSDDQIADFSSRGPVFWEGIGDIVKPDVSAPGVDILSSVPDGGYEHWDGTSMACPHVAGTVALMLSLAIKNRVIDQVDVDFLKRALEQTAVDLGPPGKDNDYGSGRIDAFEALRRIPSPPPVGFPHFLGSALEVSATEVTIGDTLLYTLRVINSGTADASNLVATVPNIPPILSNIVPLDGGTYDAVNRRVRWERSRLAVGETVTFRFQATAGQEGDAILEAQIIADNAALFTTNAVTTNIVSPFDPYENNDTPAMAKRIDDPSDFTSRRAYLAPNDQDWFVANLPKGKVFRVEVQAWQRGSMLDAGLRVTDADGQPLPQDQVFINAPNYIGRDPVAIVKGTGGDVYLQVMAEEGAPSNRQRGSYILRVREITPAATLSNFGADRLTGDKALKAGEIGIVLGTLRNLGQVRQSVVSFQFDGGLPLVPASQARFFAPSSLISSAQITSPSLGDWLLFIADANEVVFSEVPSLPVVPLNLGRLWAQERDGVLFLRAEIAGRLLTALADMVLTIDLDTNGDQVADAQIRLTDTEQALIVGTARRSLAYLNIGERIVDLGIRLADIGEPSRLWVRAQLHDKVSGMVDDAPDRGWALLKRSSDGFAFGVAPAAGTLVGQSQLTVWLVADARRALLGNYDVIAKIPASESTLTSELSHTLPVTVIAGPPARLSLTLSATEVPAPQQRVLATATVTDSAGNPAKDLQVRFSVAPLDIGTVEGAGAVTKVTGENGQASATILLTGRAGTLTVQAEVLRTTLTASRSLTVTLGAPTRLEVTTTPPPDAEGKVQVTVNSNVVLRATLRDAAGNPIARPDAPISFQVALIPVEGSPQVWLVTDGKDRDLAAGQLADADGAVNGSVQISLPAGTKAGEMSIAVSVRDAPEVAPHSFTVVVLPSIPMRLAFVDADLESQLRNAITTPLVKVVDDELVLRVRVTDTYDNPVPSQRVTLTVQQGLIVQTETRQTDANGEVTFTLAFSTPGSRTFWVTAGGLRLPSDWQQTYRVQVLPKLDGVPAEHVRGFGIPFLPPIVPAGQTPPSLSDLLGVDPKALQERIVAYDPSRRTWVSVSPDRPVTDIAVGTGFFIKPRQTLNFRPRGGRLVDTDRVRISLQAGWNLVSFPIAVNFPWRLSAVQVSVGAVTHPLAQSTDIVVPFLWRWDASAQTYRLVYDRSVIDSPALEGEIKAWEAYWVFAFQPCTLELPVPFGSRQEIKPAKSSPWRLVSLRVQWGGEAASLVLGLSDDRAVTELPLPPHPTATPRIALVGKDGELLGASVKPVSQKVIWTLVLTGTEREEEVSVVGDNLVALGREWSLSLVDPVTNIVWSLRAKPYRLRVAAGETRTVYLVAEQLKGQPLRVQNLRTIAVRGRSVVVEFGLTAPARTEIVVQTLTGRTVRVLESGQARGAGIHRLAWDGLERQGQRLPSGTYLIRVRAMDEQGRLAQGATLVRLR
ncbi:MAG: hypothetical protein IMHGJWDQ_000624 [Candidatus Fervidibacter sp.]